MRSMIQRALSQAGLQSLAQGTLGLLFPHTCMGCGARHGTIDQPLCTSCRRHLAPPPQAAVADRLARLDATAAQALAGGYAHWQFDKGGTLQRIQHALKYGNRPSLGPPLGRILGLGYAAANAPRPDAIVPIPLHRTRLLDRGYNQSERIAAGVATLLDVPLRPAVLRRNRATQSQTRLNRDQRWNNVADAFSWDPTAPSLETSTVLLIDDVLTTGATAAAAAATLRQAGASDVWIATLALAGV